MSAADPGGPDLQGLWSRRVAEYLELWQGAAAKFGTSSYRSEDLLDDWFTFAGRATRDMTAGAALLWGAAARGTPPSGGDTPASESRDN